jgi:hypothetical protein
MQDILVIIRIIRNKNLFKYIGSFDTEWLADRQHEFLNQ